MGADAHELQPIGGKIHSFAPPTRARWPKQALLACFFLLGMGLITFTNATKQAADYFNHRYKGMHTNRVVDTCYTAGFTVTLFALFFGGPGLWPNKRARMFHGYTVFLAALVVPILVDILASELTTGTPDKGTRAGLAPWAIGALIGGAAEAAVASVLNGEAAALGCNTAASYGKSVGGVFIVVLRITIKGLLPAAGHFGRLRVGVCIHLALAAVILLGCALVTSLAIPYLVDLVQQTESTEVPPGLTFQQTLSTAHTAVLGGPQGEAAAAALHAACSLAPMQPTVGSTFGLPLLEVRRLGGFSVKLSRVDSFTGGNGGTDASCPAAVLPAVASLQQQQLPTTAAHGRFDSCMRQSLTQRYIEEHAGAFRDHHHQHRHPHRRRTTDCSAASDWLAGGSSRCTTPAMSPLGAAAAVAAAAAAMPAAAAEQHMGLGRAPSMRRQLSSVLGRRVPRRSSAGGSRVSRATPAGSHRATPPPLSPLSAQGEGHTVLVDAMCDGTHTARHEQEEGRSAVHTYAARASVQGALHAEDEQQQQQQSVPHLMCVTSIRQAQHSTPQQQQEDNGVPDGEGDGGDTFSDGGSLSPSPFHSMQLSSHSFDDELDEEAAAIQLREVLGACWVVMRTVLVFQAAVLLIPIISEQNKAMVWGSNGKGTAVEIYFAQLVELAKLTGSMLGSQFLPVFHVRKPKPMLVGMSGLMVAFLAAFALTRHFMGGPAAMLALIFSCYAFGGHLNSTAFTLAKQDLPADDSRMAQMVLALTAAVGSWLAYCLSWLWVAVPNV